MHCIIHYFSATGNSLAVARQIAAILGDCVLTSMASGQPAGPIGGPGQAVGFVFPTYYTGLPRLVRRFAEKLNILPETYCFAVVTCNAFAGNALGMLEDVLQKKKLRLSYVGEVLMPQNFIVTYQGQRPHKIGDKLKKAATKTGMIAGDLTRRCEKPAQRKAVWLSRIGNAGLYKNIAAWDEKFGSDERCTGCGICIRVCPVDNIKLDGRRPVWLHHCERCLGCIHWCPLEAVQFGRQTIGRRRYHHPDVMVNDIIAGCGRNDSSLSVETFEKG